MTLDEAAKVIYDAFVASWNNATSIAFGNEISNLAKGTAPWVRLSVQELGGAQQTLGAPARWRRTCRVSIQVFCPPEGLDATVKGGDGKLFELGEKARKIFEGVSIDVAKFHGGTIGPPRADPVSPKWRTSTVTVPFYFMDRH